MKLSFKPNYICCVCGTDISLPHWYRHYDKNGIFDRKYICSKCRYVNLYQNMEILKKEYLDSLPEKVCKLCGSNKTTGNWHTYSEDGTYPICKHCYDTRDSCSDAGMKKILAKSRNKKLGKNTSKGKGFRAEQGILLTLGLENCNLKKDNFGYKMDGYHHDGDKRIQIKSGALLCYGNGVDDYEWSFDKIKLENCDTVYLAGMDRTYSKYLKILKIPTDYIKSTGLKYIRINPNTVKKWEWNKYEIDVKPFNDIYNNLSIDKCTVLEGDDNEV